VCVCPSPATSAKTATAALRPWAHVSAEVGERGRETDGANGNDNVIPCLVLHGRDREGGGGETATDGGGRRDVVTGEGGPSSPELVTPVTSVLGGDW
jgi:hypothetical protein